MSNTILRAVTGASSVMISVGIGVVTNLITEKPSVALGVGLGMLVVCAIAATVLSLRWERHAAADSGDGTDSPAGVDSRAGAGTPAQQTRPEAPDQLLGDGPGYGLAGARQVAWRRGWAFSAGNDVTVGVSGTHLTVIVAILAGLAAAISLSWPTGEAVTSTGGPEPARPGTDAAEPESAVSGGPGTARPGTGATGSLPPRPSGSAASRQKRTYQDGTFSFLMMHGYAYDIDHPADGKPTNIGFGDDGGADAERDLYLSGPGRVWQLYVPAPPTREIDGDALAVTAGTTKAEQCRNFSTGRMAFLHSETAGKGDKACLRTTEGNWAMIELLDIPDDPADPVEVRVTVLR